MTTEDIAKLRSANQQISSKKFSSVRELVSYMGGLQAQDYQMAKWAVGLRLKEADEQLINSAIEKGDLLRTHLLRPTWHFVSRDNIYPMLELTASRIRKSMSSRNKELELNRAVFRKSNKIIRTALKGNNHMTREAIIKLLNSANIKTDKNRASHLLAEAELTGIICSGIPKESKPTYALLEERVKQKLNLNKEESLEKLAETYFTSRGPATINDFVWWSGLTITDARKAIEMIKPKMNSFELNSQIYLFFTSSSGKRDNIGKVFLLPTYDEFMISYKDRSAVLISESHRKIISTNGIFRATVVYDGRIIGIWKRISKNDYLFLEINYFAPPDKKIKSLVNDEAERFGIFMRKGIRGVGHKFDV